MATASNISDENTMVAEIFIAAPPQRVFQAIADPDQRRQWWGQRGLYRTTESQSDLRPGGKWWSVGVGADGTSFRVEGEYLEVVPPRLLVHTWMASWTHSLETVVRWELEPREVHGLEGKGPVKQGTLVKVRHEGFANAKIALDHESGWKRILLWMQGFVETGATVDTRPPLTR
ncbi:MAG TPA: SRPBCC domain-containing protein [Terriglobales bacterium]|nr:SRPBCC domain-containing protein [Terriglobales bacterium]